MKIEQNLNPILQTLSSGKPTEDTNKKQDLQEEQLLKGESSAVLSGAKILKETGYPLNKGNIGALREYLKGTESEIKEKLNALQVALQKEIPLKESILSRICLSNSCSLADLFKDADSKHSGAKREKDAGNTSNNTAKNLQIQINKQEQLLNKLFEIVENKEIKSKYNDFNSRNDCAVDKEKKKTFTLIEKTEEFKINIKEKLFENLNPSNSLGVEDMKEEDFTASQEEPFEFTDADLDSLLHILSPDPSGPSLETREHTLFVEQRLTQRIIEIKKGFQEIKQDLSKDISALNETALSKEEKIQLLARSIDQLDRTIMKSELSLYMDLKSEKSLIEISSKLQIARKFLSQGKLSEAEKLLKDSKSILEGIKFEPSIKKAYAVFSGKIPEKVYSLADLELWAKKSTEQFVRSEKSPLSLLQYLRKMGLNHEVEKFQEQQNFKFEAKQNELKNQPNLKELLLRLQSQSNEQNDHSKTNKMIEHIEGSQLKNKILDSREAQSIELELPIQLNGRIKNVKVFIKSPQKMLKLDWENFDMFFVLSTERLGELGIKVAAVQRQISVKIINDSVDNIDSKSNFNNKFKSEIESFGYRLIRMVTESWKHSAQGQSQEQKKIPTAEITNKGSKSTTADTAHQPQRIDIKI